MAAVHTHTHIETHGGCPGINDPRFISAETITDIGIEITSLNRAKYQLQKKLVVFQGVFYFLG